MTIDDSVIDYVICGIPDVTADKNILYGVVTIDEFKVKIELYDRIKKQFRVGLSSAVIVAVSTPAAAIIVRCFNCGDKGHQSRDCPDAGKGPTCFTCRSFGLKAHECPVKSMNSSEESPKFFV